MRAEKLRMCSILILIALGLHQLISSAFAAQEIDASSIERPLTLPEGLALWRAWSFVSSAQPFSWFPLGFEHGVTDDITLVWLLIPVEIRWRAYSDTSREKQFALTFNILGAVTSETQNFNWSPFVRVDFRWRPTHGFAFDAAIACVGELRREAQPFAATGILELRPRFQPWSWLWIAPSLALWSEWGAPRSLYWGPTPASATGDWGLRLPVGGAIGLTFSNRVELESRLIQLGIGTPSGFTQTQWMSSLTVWF